MNRHWLLTALLAAVLVLPAVAAAQVENGTEILEPKDTSPGPIFEDGIVTADRPLSFGIDYTLVTDYVWRGANLSEYDGEGREDLNHQLNVWAAYDTGDFGTFGGLVWLQWFAGWDQAGPDPDGSHLQEVNYVLNWSYDLSRINEALPVVFELGWIGYNFPEFSGDAQFTHELYVTLAMDDSSLWGTDQAVLNPYVSYYHDLDDFQGGWLEVGISHDFALAELGLADVPILGEMTLTPAIVLGVDHRYYESTTKAAAMVFGLALSYDLGSALGMDPEWGSLAITSFINYNLGLADSARNVSDGAGGQQGLVDDTLYGGVNLAYEW